MKNLFASTIVHVASAMKSLGAFDFVDIVIAIIAGLSAWIITFGLQMIFS